MTGLLEHQLKSDIMPNEEMLRWMIPPQTPAALMFCINAEGKIAVAEGNERAKLIKEYEDFIAMRKARLPENPVDKMFDKEKGEIVELPAGTILEALKAHKFSALGPATYWNPDKGQYYLLMEHTLKALPKNVVLAAKIESLAAKAG